MYAEKSKLNIADMWLIPLDRVTYYTPHADGGKGVHNESFEFLWFAHSVYLSNENVPYLSIWEEIIV